MRKSGGFLPAKMDNCELFATAIDNGRTPCYNTPGLQNKRHRRIKNGNS